MKAGGKVKVMSYASQIIGLPVISEAEASRLGVVSAVYLDTTQRRVAALGIATRRVKGRDMYVPISEVVRAGRDAVLVSNEGGARQITGGTPSPGRRAKDLHGVRVTTTDGHHLGTVEDLSFSTDWVIAEVVLGDHRVLVIDPTSLAIADEIMVPADAVDRIRKEEHQPSEEGDTLARAALRDTKRILKRAWSWRGSDDDANGSSKEDR
jgi:uncharacterized protein YrrD